MRVSHTSKVATGLHPGLFFIPVSLCFSAAVEVGETGGRGQSCCGKTLGGERINIWIQVPILPLPGWPMLSRSRVLLGLLNPRGGHEGSHLPRRASWKTKGFATFSAEWTSVSQAQHCPHLGLDRYCSGGGEAVPCTVGCLTASLVSSLLTSVATTIIIPSLDNQ